MAFIWLESSGNPHAAEYARAYDRAIKSGSIDCVISWELGGFRTQDGTVITESPEQVKAALKKNPLYESALNHIEAAVRALRESREMACVSHTRTV